MTRFFVTPDDDRVTGTPDRDQISGLEGNDHLNGAGGDDELRGNQGNDILEGGPGRDRLIGGPGRDTFILGPGSQTFPNADIIADFRPGQDLIGLTEGLSVADLEILGNDNTVLRDRLTGEFLAIIRGVSPSEITPEDFTRDIRPPIGGLEAIASIELSGAEIIAHDDSTQRLFVVTGDEFLEIIDIADPTNPTPVDSINLEPFTANSVAAKNGIVAVAIENTVAQNPGLVGFFNGEGEFFGAVTVGALPDMVTFTPDSTRVLVANEGEPNDDYTIDPEGSVSIIDISGGVANLTQADVTTADFTAFNDRLSELVAAGVRVFGPGATVAEDVEPEYITVSQDSQTAWISLQENNAIARLDINASEITGIFPLGFKDHSKQSVLNTFFFNPAELPSLGTTDARGEIKLSGLSGLYYEGVNPSNGNLQFITHPDRGPDDGTDANGDRIFLLPEFQPELVRFELDRESGILDIVDRIGLKRQDGTPLTGLPNLPELDPDTGVDEDGNLLEFDPLGIDAEGVVVAPDGTFWLVDEYRPSIYHFLPDGTLFHRYVPEGLDPAVGTPALPALYSERQPNRGFEAVAYDEGKIYAFIQTPLNNPISGESQTIRILEFDTETATTTGEYLYIQEDMGGGSDKIGDAVSLGNGEFLVIERDSGFGPESQKKIFRISINDATNILESQTLDTTLESLTPAELTDRGINPVSKSVYADLTALGYSFTDKPEGLALVDENIVAVLNDNDFGETGVPIGLGLIVNQNEDNALDASDRDGEINIQNWPVLGMYQPDAIASYEVNGKTYIVTANEGDSRDYDGFSEEARVKDLTLDPTAFPNATELQAEEALGRLQITTTLGDRDGDGDYDEIYAYGGRSFSIFEATDTGLELVFDSGNDFEKITAEVFPDFFNADFDDEEEVFEFDGRSDSKGPEPEGVAVGQVGDRTYAFIGLERIGGIMTYDVTDPFNPTFVQYLNNNPEFLATGDIAPEGLTFISPENSPTNNPLLVVGNEDSATTTIFEFGGDSRGPGPQPNSLVNGVASGDTTQESTVLWTRSTALGDVTFEYATDPNFRNIVGSETGMVTNPNMPVKVELTGLSGGTEYYYRVTDATGNSETGKFITANELGTQAGLTFGVTGDWRGELSPYPAIANAPEKELDFFVLHGDTVYADFPSPAVPLEQATTLAEFRDKNSEVYGTRLGLNAWGDLRASTSVLATIDDHEVTNDFAGGAAAETDPRFGTSEGLINDTPLYENGLQAFQEYNPIRDEFYGETGDPRTAGERKLYRFNTYGDDAAVIILDNRSFRDPQLPDVTDVTDAAQVAAFLAGSFDPDRTMLGAPQVADLKADLLQAEDNGITWKFVMVPEPIQNLGVTLAADRFEGYAAERTEILQFIDENNIENVVFVAADVHGTIVNNLTYQTDPLGPQIPTGAWEITTGAVAYDRPLGPTAVEIAGAIGLLALEQLEFYNSLPTVNDGDDVVDDKDDFFKDLTNQQLIPFGYDPVGLQDSGIDATLLQGDYVAAHSYGWTEFAIDPISQNLLVTTYGIESYSEDQLFANPGAIVGRVPAIVSQFEVTPV